MVADADRGPPERGRRKMWRAEVDLPMFGPPMTSRVLASAAPLLLLAAACGDGPAPASTGATSVTTSSTTQEGSSGGGSSAGDPTAAPTSSGPGTSSGPDATGTSEDASTTGPDATGTTSAGTSASTGTSGEGSSSTGGPVCGDGVVEGGETCDDGSGVGCDSDHDGGDGVCVPADTCSPGFVLAMGLCVPELWTDHVHIMVSNTCEMTVDPPEFTVPPGQKLRLDYHNHSQDYAVDVWMHYGGGFLELQPGQTWMEKYEHCFGPAPSEGYATISTACSEYTLKIHCL